jgi:hypothetical protein
MRSLALIAALLAFARNISADSFPVKIRTGDGSGMAHGRDLLNGAAAE